MEILGNQEVYGFDILIFCWHKCNSWFNVFRSLATLHETKSQKDLLNMNKFTKFLNKSCDITRKSWVNEYLKKRGSDMKKRYSFCRFCPWVPNLCPSQSPFYGALKVHLYLVSAIKVIFVIGFDETPLCFK